MAGRTSDARGELDRLTCHHRVEVRRPPENDYPARYLLGAQPLQRRPKHQPAPAQRHRALAGGDGHRRGRSERRADRVANHRIGAQRDREPESRAHDTDRHQAGADHPQPRSPARAAHREAQPARPRPRSASTQHDASTRPTGHTIPAAVTIQLVSAAGTRRTSTRGGADSVTPAGRDTCCTNGDVRHGPGRAACPAAPGRCRRHRRAGRRW